MEKTCEFGTPEYIIEKIRNSGINELTEIDIMEILTKEERSQLVLADIFFI